MKVTFFSNFLNHHQLPFCLAMDRLTTGNFTFVATSEVPQERLSLGYTDMNGKYPFVLQTQNSIENTQKALQLALESDVVISGSAPDKFIIKRLKKGRITFKYSERLYKKGLNIHTFPRALAVGWLRHGRFQKYPLYMLCASAFTTVDCTTFGHYVGRTYKWGYFPDVKCQNHDALFDRKRENKRVSLLWVGRLIEWKHPDSVVLLAERLKMSGLDFEVNIIGNGNMELRLREVISKKGLNAHVHMLGSMPPTKVRDYMEQADIFLFTSDFNEGWGAVLNEAMNSGCAVVASHAIGSVPFLINHGVNGFVYQNAELDDLYRKVIVLMKDVKLREKMGWEAYLTLAKLWNAEVAAERLIKLTHAIQNGNEFEVEDNGPCSQAKMIPNDWFQDDY